MNLEVTKHGLTTSPVTWLQTNHLLSMNLFHPVFKKKWKGRKGQNQPTHLKDPLR